MSVFVDTNVILAVADQRDNLHSRASLLVEQLSKEPLFTTDAVLQEAWGLANRRIGNAAADSFLDALLHTPLSREVVRDGDLERALELGVYWADRRFDLVDRISFVVMERLGCTRVASFDNDFAVYRYGRDRKGAFEVIR